MPCIVRENDERKNKEIALIENIQREDLNPIDKARGFRQLLDDYGMTQQQLADTIGLNRSTVTNTLRLLNLDERVMQLAIDGKLNEGHCRSLLCITDPDKQYAAAIRIIEKGETVRDIEKKVQDQKKYTNPLNEDIARLERELKLITSEIKEKDVLEKELSKTINTVDDILNNQTITNAMLKTIIDVIEVDSDSNVEVRLKLLNEIGSTPAVITNFNDINPTVTKSNVST